MNAKPKLPTELVAIAVGCCLFGMALTVSSSIRAVVLPRYPLPDKVLHALYKDPSVGPLIICEGIGGILFGGMALTAGLMVFARAKAASSAMYATLAVAAAGVVAEIVLQGWLVVPALRKLAPGLKFPESLMYDPRLRPAFPIAVGIVALAVLYGITRILRRPHVRAALAHRRGP